MTSTEPARQGKNSAWYKNTRRATAPSAESRRDSTAQVFFQQMVYGRDRHKCAMTEPGLRHGSHMTPISKSPLLVTSSSTSVQWDYFSPSLPRLLPHPHTLCTNVSAGTYTARANGASLRPRNPRFRDASFSGGSNSIIVSPGGFKNCAPFRVQGSAGDLGRLEYAIEY